MPMPAGAVVVGGASRPTPTDAMLSGLTALVNLCMDAFDHERRHGCSAGCGGHHVRAGSRNRYNARTQWLVAAHEALGRRRSSRGHAILRLASSRASTRSTVESWL